MASLAQRNGTTGQRVALYVRVSSEEQVEGYSLDAQRRAASAYCESHGWEIVHTYADEGKSARTDNLDKRPQFKAMLADAEAGLVDVVLVHKLDRFARNIVVTLTTLDRLNRSGVGFVSLGEQMDFTTPFGKVMLATLAAFAQYFSDNLSKETSKGKNERKAQGLYNGLLPFGVKKNRDGQAVPDPDTYPGLLMAYRLAAAGKSDREIADALNAAGYRTTGNRGRNLFSKDTVRMILLNRFYLGELPDGAGGWMPGAHDPMLDADLYDEAQRTRAANRTNGAKVRSAAKRYSLTGLAVCGYCRDAGRHGRMHMQSDPTGKARILCYSRQQSKAAGCPQRSMFLAPLEDQLGAYLATFTLPDEEVERIIALYRAASRDRDDAESSRRELTGRLERIRKSFEWGDKPESEYRAERAQIERELAAIKSTSGAADMLAQAAAFLRNLPGAWAAAKPDQRNALARLVFESIEVRGDRAVAIVPQPDFAPFFLTAAGNANTPDSLEPGCQAWVGSYGSDGDAWGVIQRPPRIELPDLRPPGPCRTVGRYAVPKTGITGDRWPEVVALARQHGLRAAARLLGVSHEAVRGIVRRVEQAEGQTQNA